jgi:hypothetical protein
MSSRSEPMAPSRLRILFQAPELTTAKRIAADPITAVKKAEDIGYVDGFFDRHSVEHEFRCAAEWLAWLNGWRLGQIELKRQHASAEQMMSCLSVEVPSNAALMTGSPGEEVRPATQNVALCVGCH